MLQSSRHNEVENICMYVYVLIDPQVAFVALFEGWNEMYEYN